MSLERILGLGAGHEADAEHEAALRRISQRLSRLEPRAARYLACFASVLARVANADLDIASAETAEMQRRLAALAQLSDEEAGLVVELAERQSRRLGEKERREVTREFRDLAKPEQRTELVFCLYAVAAADGVVTPGEDREITAIADEIGVARREVSPTRARRLGFPGD